AARGSDRRARRWTCRLPGPGELARDWAEILARFPGRGGESLRIRDVRGVEAGAKLGRAPLRLEGDEHEAEAAGVAARPLEVVEEAPGEVAPDVGALPPRPLHRLEVGGDVLPAPAVVEGAADRGGLGQACAVLGHVDRQARLAPHAQQDVLEALRVDLPAHVGGRPALR